MREEMTAWRETFDRRALQLRTLMKIVEKDIDKYIDSVGRNHPHGCGEPDDWSAVNELTAIFQRLVPVMPIFYDDEESHGFDEAMMVVNARLGIREAAVEVPVRMEEGRNE